MHALIISYRLGQADGVSVEAAKWKSALHRLGYRVTTLAGEGIADIIVPALARNAYEQPLQGPLVEALNDIDVVVVENLLSLPMNLPAARAVGMLLRGRPTIVHHHDMPWQRPGYDTSSDWPPSDHHWRHVTINHATRRDLEHRGIRATVIPNTVEFPVPRGRRETARRFLRLGPQQTLVLQPTRAIARKNVPAGLRLAAKINAVYWLTGSAEDGYDKTLSKILASHSGPIRTGLPEWMKIADAYAAADVIVFPSELEGFGNPVIESAVYRKPLAIGWYPVLDELRQYGFRWFRHDDHEPLRKFIDDPDTTLLNHNECVAKEHFSSDRLDRALAHELRMLGFPVNENA
jgi:glycosyltransferase involved in cell wall biosynthesis